MNCLKPFIFNIEVIEAASMDYYFIDGEDRISSLPDHIICYILSFLPTKHAVATSVLSTRWKYVWTSVPLLDFDDRLHGDFCTFFNRNLNRGSHVTFRNFVSRVMLLNDITHIQKLRLISVHHKNHTPICTWLQLAISRHIQELELDFYMSEQKDYVKLPRKIFVSSSLVVLKLSHLPLDVPSYVCFPVLKKLELRCVVGLNDNCFQNLLSGCKVLEELVMEENTKEEPRVINISIQTLKRFFFSYRCMYVVDITEDFPYNFIINAPNLEFFYFRGRLTDNFVVRSMATLVNAHLDLRKTGVFLDDYSHCLQRVCNLIGGVTNAKFLSLSNDIVQLLCTSYDVNLPVFYNLRKLAFGISVDISWKRLMTKFFNCSPNLEILNLDNKRDIIRNIEQQLKYPPRPVPQYLLSQIKDILIKDLYTSFRPEAVDAAERLLRDVNILKRLKINCLCPYMLRNQICYVLS